MKEKMNDIPLSEAIRCGPAPMGDIATGNLFWPSHAGSCPQCHQILPPIWTAAAIYFQQGAVTCSRCNTASDLWDVILTQTLVEPPMPMHLVNLGATYFAFMCEIEADKYH